MVATRQSPRPSQWPGLPFRRLGGRAIPERMRPQTCSFAPSRLDHDHYFLPPSSPPAGQLQTVASPLLRNPVFSPAMPAAAASSGPAHSRTGRSRSANQEAETSLAGATSTASPAAHETNGSGNGDAEGDEEDEEGEYEIATIISHETGLYAEVSGTMLSTGRIAYTRHPLTPAPRTCAARTKWPTSYPG